MKGKAGTGSDRRLLVGHVRKTAATLATSTDLFFELGHSEGEADLILGQPTDVLIGFYKCPIW